MQREKWLAQLRSSGSELIHLGVELVELGIDSASGVEPP